MTKTVGRWLVYERKNGEFVFLSKPLKTKEEADKERLKLKARPGENRSAIGVGFIRLPASK
jgi:hypothetical protein